MDTGGRVVVVVLLLECVRVCDDERWEGKWSPRWKKDGGGGKLLEEGSWRSRATPKLAG